MNAEFFTLIISTITISFVHTASGPDHYLPFIAFSRSRKWSLTTTVFWTILCGIGHVLSSVLIGLLAVVLGWQLAKIDGFQSIRGDIASWGLFYLGLIYLVWGLYRAYKNRPHKHFDVYEGDDIYVYTHKHGDNSAPKNRMKVTPLILLAIFVMGPSEPIIPLIFYSGVNNSTFQMILLIGIFILVTVLTMLTIVLLGLYGYSFIKTDTLERYTHAIAGAIVAISGAGMVFWGW